MKPPQFEYAAPTTLGEALDALDDDALEARPLAGGQSLVPMLNFRLADPERLVDLNRIEALARVERAPDGWLRLGAMTRQRRLERDPEIAAAAPLLAETAPFIAHAPIRNRGAVGGSVAHADPAAELPAALLALGARARITRKNAEDGMSERTVPLAEFFLGPFFTVLEPGELLTAVEVPPSAPCEGTAFDEVARRRGDYALAGVAARVRADEAGVCGDAAIALVNAAPTPMLAARAAQALIGRPLDQGAINAAARAAARDADPAADMHASEAYRRHLIRVLTRRVLTRAAERARAEVR